MRSRSATPEMDEACGCRMPTLRAPRRNAAMVMVAVKTVMTPATTIASIRMPIALMRPPGRCPCVSRATQVACQYRRAGMATATHEPVAKQRKQGQPDDLRHRSQDFENV